MTTNQKPHFWRLAWVGIFLFSLVLRFWHISQFNQLVFDEVYFATFANNYLTQTEFFDTHPPLGKYLIAVGIWVGQHLPFPETPTNTETGSLLTPFDYRWMNAAVGSFVPLLVGGIAYQLGRWRWQLPQAQTYAIAAALLVALDGLFLVESRYALINIYLVFFGLCGQYAFLRGVSARGRRRWMWFAGAGGALGAAAAVKWNGLGFWLGLQGFGAIAWWQHRQKFSPQPSSLGQDFPWVSLYITGQAAITYGLLWIPHLLIFPEPGFWEMQVESFSYHQRIGSSEEVHPYCSSWYSWVVMARPIAYLYQTNERTGMVRDVHAMGNPVLWWLGAIAILACAIVVVVALIDCLNGRLSSRWLVSYGRSSTSSSNQTPVPAIPLYLLVNYLANWLPWSQVSRCLFLYHYMSAALFAWLALAWLVAHWFHRRELGWRWGAIAVLLAVGLSFLFWLPIYLGFPLSQKAWELRMWFESWI
ncbi:phospholipid carrier-dependent glycosyltransferase [Geitlerinema sp. PCC 9228]|jgi:dolichyl-phosphate-mannose--protein O-mannosyl transferase|uniref:phospholipid carrier-dependent glycosyltransferase n=1 Tax=Geitlerinema sp. PCC 9228 TaxID=111611 RepID=UPI0008F9C59A|nr:phospholipid carrier-dependent glycosyltransferase [Geitlerinema sp. PCC 9228]